MNLKGFLSISGKPGLYKLVKQARNGIIVESLLDGQRIPAYATSKISALEDIAMYTKDGDVSLGEVFSRIYTKEDGKETISHKSSGNQIEAYFSEILPEYDADRVYVSDMKRLFNWYNLLHKCDMLNLPEEVKEEEATDETEQEEATETTENNTADEVTK